MSVSEDVDDGANRVVDLRPESENRIIDAFQPAQDGFGIAHVVARHLDVVVIGERAADRFIERERRC